MAGKSSLHLIGQIPQDPPCSVCEAFMEVSESGQFLKRNRISRSHQGAHRAQDGHPLPWWHWQGVGEGTREMTVMEI